MPNLVERVLPLVNIMSDLLSHLFQPISEEVNVLIDLLLRAYLDEGPVIRMFPHTERAQKFIMLPTVELHVFVFMFMTEDLRPFHTDRRPQQF